MALQIDIAANTRQAQGQVKDLGESLEDVSDSLDDMAREAQRGGDKTEGALKDTGREVEKLEKKFKDLTDEAKTQTRKGADVGDGYKKGFKEASEGADDFKQEAQQSAKETAASFDGSAESIADMFQEVAANAFGGFGPAGAAAGLAAAAGLGLVFSEMQAQEEQAEKLRSRLNGLYQGALESGRDYIDQSQFIAESNDLRFNTDRADEWKQLQADAKKLGLEEADIIKANAGDMHAQLLVEQRINDLRKETYGDTTNIDMLRFQAQEMGGIEERWIDIREVTRAAKQESQNAAETNSRLWKEAIAGAESAEVAVDDFGNTLYKLPNGKEIVIEAKTGKATDDVSKFKTDTDAAIEQLNAKDVQIRLKVDDSAWEAWKRKPRQFDANVVVRGKEWQ